MEPKHELYNSMLNVVDATYTGGQRRPYRDTVFTFLFLGSILTTYGFGIVAITRADFNLDSKLMLSQFNRNTNQCEVVVQQPVQQRGQLKDPENSSFLSMMAMVSLVALVLTVPAGLLSLRLLRRYTRGLVLATRPLMPLVPLGGWLVWFTSCYDMNDTCAKAMPVSNQIMVAVYFPILSAMLAYQLWKNYWSRHSLDMTVQLLTTATQLLLQEHYLSLLLWNNVFLLGSMALVTGPIFSFGWYAFNNGRVVPNFEVVNDLSKGCDQGLGYPCCQEEFPAWIIAYFILAGFTFLWVVLVSVYLQVLAVSGTVSLWYFAPAGSSTADNVKRSFRNAFGPSFGTACNLGTFVTMLVVALVGSVQKAMTRVLMRSSNSTYKEGLMLSIVRKCLPWMLHLPECHPRFALNFAAISGDSFWESSKKAHNLLHKNLLSLTGTNIMAMATQTHFLLPSFYVFLQSILVYGMMELFSNILLWMKVSITLMSGGAAMLGIIILFQCALASIADTIYICYAMEKDVGQISRPEVCQAFMSHQPEVERQD